MVKKKESNVKQLVSILMLLFSMSIVVYFCLVSVFATTSSSPEEAYRKLTQSVQKEISSNTYELKGGGYIAGANLFVLNTTDNSNSYDLDESAFQTLTSSAQSQLVSDIAKASTAQVGNNGITDETVDSWWSHLQSKPGVGSKFLATVLEDTNPDFVTARKWYKPFSGPISTILAVMAILVMSLLGIVIAADIFYITIPPVRLFVDEKGDNGNVPVSKIFSHAAISAVKEVEEGNDASSKKHAIGIYFKNRVIEIIILCICLLYLVNGQIYTFVGWILDLVSGITG